MYNFETSEIDRNNYVSDVNVLKHFLLEKKNQNNFHLFETTFTGLTFEP